ncbi:uncharacterized protein HaLaN_22818, partial [Haematococcus lacustris]
ILATSTPSSAKLELQPPESCVRPRPGLRVAVCGRSCHLSLRLLRQLLLQRRSPDGDTRVRFPCYDAVVTVKVALLERAADPMTKPLADNPVMDPAAAVNVPKPQTPSKDADIMSELSDTESILGTSPVSPLPGNHFHADQQERRCSEPPFSSNAQQHRQSEPSWLHVSLKTICGCSEILGHTLEDRTSVAIRQDSSLVATVQATSTVQLRSPTQRHLFTVAPLDVLVTRDEATGQATFHIVRLLSYSSSLSLWHAAMLCYVSTQCDC